MPRRPPTFNPRTLNGQLRPDRQAIESRRFLDSAAWKRLRAVVLSNEPLCRQCEAEGRLTVATIVHHVKDRSVRPDLALDPDNLEPICGPHHTRLHKSKA